MVVFSLKIRRDLCRNRTLFQRVENSPWGPNKLDSKRYREVEKSQNTEHENIIADGLISTSQSLKRVGAMKTYV